MGKANASLKTTGMHCPSCAKLIEMNVGELQGVDSVPVSLEEETTDVVYDPEAVDVEAIIAQIEEAGYGVERD
jgi:copper chaperone CopZ